METAIQQVSRTFRFARPRQSLSRQPHPPFTFAMKTILLRTILGVLLLAATTISALADDSTSGTSPSQDGTYIGFALGGAYSALEPHSRLVAAPFGTAGYYFDLRDSAQIDPILQRSVGGIDLTGSLLFGYDHIDGHLLWGIEADLTGMDFSESKKQGPEAFNSSPIHNFSTETSASTKFIFSLRPKIGYVQDKYSFYVSAGPSLARIKTRFQYSDTAAGNNVTYKNTKTALGISTGIGMGYDLGQGWQLRGDYVFTYFPNVLDHTLQYNNAGVDDIRAKADFLSNNVRLGLFYHF